MRIKTFNGREHAGFEAPLTERVNGSTIERLCRGDLHNLYASNCARLHLKMELNHTGSFFAAS